LPARLVEITSRPRPFAIGIRRLSSARLASYENDTAESLAIYCTKRRQTPKIPEAHTNSRARTADLSDVALPRVFETRDSTRVRIVTPATRSRRRNARALASNPRVLISEEAGSHLDLLEDVGWPGIEACCGDSGVTVGTVSAVATFI
jgi:hypothetical protein